MNHEMVEREALLFEAGDYPDKGLLVTSQDLDRMAESFGDPAPIRLEHTDGPLTFGWLVKVWRKGSALFGKLIFKPSAWDLVKQSGSKALSVGLDRETLAIQEVSLVRKARISAAQVFSENGLACFLVDIPGDSPMALDADRQSVEDECRQLRMKMAARDARDEMEALKRLGKIAPAAEQAALALLSCQTGTGVLFGEQATTPAEAFRHFLLAQPPVVHFGELAAAGKTKPSLFGEADRRIFDMLGVCENDVRKSQKNEEMNQI